MTPNNILQSSQTSSPQPSSEKLPPAVTETQPGKTVRNLRTFSPKWDVSRRSLPSRLRESWEEEGKDSKSQWDGGH